MTAQRLTTATTPGRDLPEDALLASSDPLETARQHVAETALADGAGRPGRARAGVPPRRPRPSRAAGRPGPRSTRLADGVGPLPSSSLVTLEPGGQIELSTPPGDDVVSAVAALRADREVLRDPPARRRASAPRRWAPTSPGRSRGSTRAPRYLAMEQHFDALGCAGAGQGDDDGHRRAAGQPRRRPGRRLGGAARPDPHAGADAGGRSRRPRRTSAVAPRAGTRCARAPGRASTTAAATRCRRASRPQAWATYALNAPVMLVRRRRAAAAR